MSRLELATLLAKDAALYAAWEAFLAGTPMTWLNRGER